MNSWRPTASHADPQGQFDDWVELYNAGDAAIDMAGMYLTDDPAVPTQWKIAGTPRTRRESPRRATLSSGLTMTPRTPACMRRSSWTPTKIGSPFFDTDGTTLLDQVGFTNQRPDVSYGEISRRRGFLAVHDPPHAGDREHAPYEGISPTRSSATTGASMTSPSR